MGRRRAIQLRLGGLGVLDQLDDRQQDLVAGQFAATGQGVEPLPQRTRTDRAAGAHRDGDGRAAVFGINLAATAASVGTMAL